LVPAWCSEPKRRSGFTVEQWGQMGKNACPYFVEKNYYLPGDLEREIEAFISQRQFRRREPSAPHSGPY
jgi:hypothetical protein